MAMDNKPASDLKDNRYANAEVEVVCGEEFEKAYNDYLNRRVSMAMRHVAEYVDAGGDVKALEKRLQDNNDE
jgi:hypothetical protein